MKLLLKSLLVAGIVLSFTGCGPQLTTASSAPKGNMTLPASLAENKDALYYNKLINQYLVDESKIPAEKIVRTKEEQKEIDKKSKKEFIESFEKVGLSKEEGLKAYREHKQSGATEMRLKTLPDGADDGYLRDTKGKTTMIMGKAITNKDTKNVQVVYRFENKAETMKKYAELSSMFKVMLTPAHNFKLTDEVINEQLYRKNVSTMQDFYNKYKEYPNIMPEPEKYLESIEMQKKLAEQSRDYPFVNFKYAWSSDARIGGAITGANMPNTIMLIVKPMDEKEQWYDAKNGKASTDFNIITVTLVKVLY